VSVAAQAERRFAFAPSLALSVLAAGVVAMLAVLAVGAPVPRRA
jgi:hypothetical protein